ncbi:MAG TPA: three-Cys-motif partner protein TcmP [Planctomycetota bacterium]|nr:three-Cys-motif partner protein TcmP [Planctomycetota bacterium]
MSRLRPELYVGREQTYVKHFVLGVYLEKLAYKIGMRWNGATLNYVDGFAGPWQSKDEKLEDTSPHIAVRVLRGVRGEVRRLGKPRLDVRAMFVEKDADKFKRLQESFADCADLEIVVRHGDFESNVGKAVAFGTTGARSFCFTFIDPCGWTGYGLHAVTPLLSVKPGEVLINFMTHEINRFIDNPDPAKAATFQDLYGSTTFRDAWAGMDGMERQDVMVAAYCHRVREAGRFAHVASAVVINPLKDRAHYHLVYGTRHDEGLRTFREAERRALSEQEGIRARAQQRKRKRRTGGQQELFDAEALATPYVDGLRAHYRTRARDVVARMLSARGAVPFDELVIAAMQQPMTAEQDVRDFLTEEARRGAVTFDGLAGRERSPKWNEKHSVRLLERS